MVNRDKNDGFRLITHQKNFGGQATPDRLGKHTTNVPQCYCCTYSTWERHLLALCSPL